MRGRNVIGKRRRDTGGKAPALAWRLGYRPALDGVRAIAVLMVMVAHFGVPHCSGGVLGLDVFFVLSGFLITSLLIEEWESSGKIRLGRFYLRRVLRLFPALFVILVVTAPFVARIWTITALCYVSNWAIALGHVGIGPISHLWSLSVEEQFYLIWPILLIGMLRVRLPRRGIVSVIALLAAGSAALKILGWKNTGSWVRLYHGSDTCADALLIGCAFALLLSWGMLPRQRWFRSALSVAAMAAFVGFGYLAATTDLRSEMLYHFGGLTLASLAVGISILYIMTTESRPAVAILSWKPLVGIGRISYGLYLWHHAIAWLPNPWIFGKLGPVALLVMRFALSFAVALTSYYAVERPMLKLKRRFSARPARPVPSAG
jgi:peptidoglycan/LPS O-acetylase OafA/YrhL